MDLDVFLSRQNIRHYRRLLDFSITPAERSAVLKLLAQDMVTLKSVSRMHQSMTPLPTKCIPLNVGSPTGFPTSFSGPPPTS